MDYVGNILNSTSGVNFTTFANPKIAKKTDGLTIFFALLGSAHVRAAHKMLVKSTPEIQHRYIK